jgi:hypothetical protein
MTFLPPDRFTAKEAIHLLAAKVRDGGTIINLGNVC